MTTHHNAPAEAVTSAHSNGYGLLPPLREAAHPTPLLVRPTWRFMVSHPAHMIALGLGSGLARRAPGTVGTLWAWAAFLVIDMTVNHPGTWAWIIGLGTLVGWWACTVTARHMGQPDSSHMVVDEVIAFWIVLWLITPASLGWQALAFGLFRFFDAVKFGPMAWADQHFKGFGWRGGFGVMLDDFAAALCTLLVLAVTTRMLS